MLNGLGWNLHCVWSTAWFRDRGAEERRLRDATNEALHGPQKAWPVGRGGSKTTEAVQAVTRSMIGHQLVAPEPGFLAIPGQQNETVRVPIEVHTRTRRTIDEVPWAKLYQAVLEVVRGASTVDQDELVTFIARLYRWNRTGAQIAAGVATAIAYLIGAGDLQRKTDGTVALAT